MYRNPSGMGTTSVAFFLFLVDAFSTNHTQMPVYVTQSNLQIGTVQEFVITHKQSVTSIIKLSSSFRTFMTQSWWSCFLTYAGYSDYLQNVPIDTTHTKLGENRRSLYSFKGVGPPCVCPRGLSMTPSREAAVDGPRCT
mmetsp:Transcript_43598/g.115140  ORF Transcript_43598/g.115140 Transcript_43598/m.115140 type:complete len:139 (+) Transcript_43598:1597-2013(+)